MPLATPRLSGAWGRLSLALNWGPPALLDCIAIVVLLRAGWRPMVDCLHSCRDPGARQALPSLGLPRLFTQVAVLMSRQAGKGGQRAHHPSDGGRNFSPFWGHF